MIVLKQLCNFFRSSRIEIKVSRCLCTLHQSGEGDYDFEKLVIEDKQYAEIKKNYIVCGHKAHTVMVCQPYIKYGVPRDPELFSLPKLRLQEAISLVHSIPKWMTVDSGLFPVPHNQRELFFSDTVIEQLTSRIKGNTNISAVLIAANKLTGVQQNSLQKTFGVPVFDRFSIILEIFKNHAITGEAKVQIGLAEIAYMRGRASQMLPENKGNFYSMGKTGQGSGETALQKFRKILIKQEKILRSALEKLDRSKSLIRERRHQSNLPVISVIGYTNSGKTSLIKALSMDESLKPENRLFATLQVTAHEVRLPSIKKALFLDSIGFISDIPKELMNSFMVTFKDVAYSDLLVHVYDASHPDLINQMRTVTETMEQLKFPEKLTSSMIHVANKIDLLNKKNGEEVIDLKVDQEEIENQISEQGLKPIVIDENHLKVSATEGINLNLLMEKIDDAIVKSTGQELITLKIPNGGPELSFLYKESSIQSVEPSENSNFLIVKTVMPASARGKFASYFRKEKTRK